MPTTPNRGWPFPAEYEDEYWTTINTLYAAQDTDVHTLATSVRSVPLGGTGAASFTAGAYLKGNGASAFATQATPIPVTDGGTGLTSLTNAITNAMLRDSGGCSVIGHASTSGGDPADIQAGADGYVLRRASNVLGFGAVDLASANATTGTLPGSKGGTGMTAYIAGLIPFGASATALTHSYGLVFADPNLYITGYATPPYIIARRSRGGPGSETAIQSGDVIGRFTTNGHFGGGYWEGSYIQATATQNWAGGNTGCDLTFWTIANVTTTPVKRLEITYDGGVNWGSGAPYGGSGTRFAQINNEGWMITQAFPIPLAQGGTGTTSLAGPDYALYSTGSTINYTPYVRLGLSASHGAIYVCNLASGIPGIVTYYTDVTGAVDSQVGLLIGRSYANYDDGLEICFSRGDQIASGIVTCIKSTLRGTHGEVGQLDFMCEDLTAGGRTNTILRLNGWNPTYGIAEVFAPAANVGLRIVSTNQSGVDRQVGLLLDRAYGEGNDTQEIWFGAGAGSSSTIIGAIKAKWTGNGVMTISGYGGGGGGQDNDLLELADGAVRFTRSATGAWCYVFMDPSGNLSFRNWPITVGDGGTGNTSFTANCVLYYNGTYIQQNASIVCSAGLGVNRPDPGGGWIDVSAGVMKNGFPYSNPAYVFEHWATGTIEKFADREGADEYRGLLPLDAIERYAREHHEHPLLQGKMKGGLFGTVDRTIEVVEESYLYLFQHEARLKKLEQALQGLLP